MAAAMPLPLDLSAGTARHAAVAVTSGPVYESARQREDLIRAIFEVAADLAVGRAPIAARPAAIAA